MIKLTKAQDRVIELLAKDKTIDVVGDTWRNAGERKYLDPRPIEALQTMSYVISKGSVRYTWLELTPAGLDYARSKGYINDK